ncbi:hypothetical protein PhCBS80983_g05269 [Powellomyces hirtus]|uniref:Metallo-beta-lactamase domain-containing protein n=1 Tax=Powellomyces hirtus TaxID=109895 RepID=A0A507DVJ2_9FUNG|nr:hypothetical protein PhCBS80983_g05269 [Powellomyces hirtus]
MSATIPPPTHIRTLTPTLTTFSRPFTRSNILPIGIRMTCIKLPTHQLVLIGPTPLDPTTLAALQNLNTPVAYIICPNVVHHLSVAAYKEHWPDAKIVGVKGLPEKRPDVTFDHVLTTSTSPPLPFEPHLQFRHFAGSRNQDTAYYHPESRTLITADLLFNLPPTEQYGPDHTFGLFARLAHSFFKPGTRSHKFFTRYAMAADADVMKKDVEFVDQNWKIERIIPAHGDIIETDAHKAFRDAFAWYF